MVARGSVRPALLARHARVGTRVTLYPATWERSPLVVRPLATPVRQDSSARTPAPAPSRDTRVQDATPRRSAARRYVCVTPARTRRRAPRTVSRAQRVTAVFSPHKSQCRARQAHSHTRASSGASSAIGVTPAQTLRDRLAHALPARGPRAARCPVALASRAMRALRHRKRKRPLGPSVP